MTADGRRTIGRVPKRHTLTEEQKDWALEQLRAIWNDLARNGSAVARELPGAFSQQHVSQALNRSVIGYSFAAAIAQYRGTTIESMGKQPSPATPRLRDRPEYESAERDARVLPGAHRIPEWAWKRAGDTQTAAGGARISAEAIRDLARLFADHFADEGADKPVSAQKILAHDRDVTTAFAEQTAASKRTKPKATRRTRR